MKLHEKDDNMLIPYGTLAYITINEKSIDYKIKYEGKELNNFTYETIFNDYKFDTDEKIEKGAVNGLIKFNYNILNITKLSKRKYLAVVKRLDNYMGTIWVQHIAKVNVKDKTIQVDIVCVDAIAQTKKVIETIDIEKMNAEDFMDYVNIVIKKIQKTYAVLSFTFEEENKYTLVLKKYYV